MICPLFSLITSLNLASTDSDEPSNKFNAKKVIFLNVIFVCMLLAEL